MAGYPMPTIRWLKDEKEFTADGDRIKPFVQEDGTFGLIFETTVASDKGIYTAIAESDEGFARYNTTYLILFNVTKKTHLGIFSQYVVG